MTKVLETGEFFSTVDSRRTSELFVITQLRHSSYRALPFHAHQANYISVLLAGEYHEQTGAGRIDYRPLTSVFHASDTGHQDVIGMAGASFLTIEARAPLADMLEVDFCKAPKVVELTRFPAVWRLLARAGDAGGEELDGEIALATIFSDVVDCARRPCRDLPSLRRAANYLEECFRESVTLANVARRCRVHPVYLGHAFRAEYGQTMGEVVASLRVRAAAEAMLHTGRGLAEIAYECGFCDQSHLTRTFRRYTGTSPRMFRQRFGRKVFDSIKNS